MKQINFFSHAASRPWAPMDETRLLWLAMELAQTKACHRTRFQCQGLIRCLQRSKHIETEMLQVFQFLFLHLPSETSDGPTFTDVPNASNLIRFVWDYLTSWVVPRFRHFFENAPTSQLYDFVDFNRFTVAYSIVFHSPKSVHDRQVMIDKGRLVIYTIVLPCVKRAKHWNLRRRQMKAIVRGICADIDRQTPDGLQLSRFTKYIATSVFEIGASGVLPVDSITGDDDATFWDDRSTCTLKTPQNPQSIRNNNAANRLQHMALRFLAKRRWKAQAELAFNAMVSDILMDLAADVFKLVHATLEKIETMCLTMEPVRLSVGDREYTVHAPNTSEFAELSRMGRATAWDLVEADPEKLRAMFAPRPSVD